MVSGKGEGSIPLTLLMDEKDGRDEGIDGVKYRRMIDGIVNKGMNLLNKIRDSTVVTSDAEKHFEP